MPRELKPHHQTHTNREEPRMSPITEAKFSQRPRRRWIVLAILSLVLSAYSVAAALWGTTENAFITPADQLLWIALPFGVLGALFITLHVFARRLPVR